MVGIHLRTAWHHIRRSPFQALAAFFVLSITFFVITTLTVLVYSSAKLIDHFETRPQIIAFIKDETGPSQITELKAKLTDDWRTQRVDYITKEQALEIYKKATSDNPLLSELVNPSIFPASLEITLTNLNNANELIKELKNEEIIDQVGFTASLEGEDALFDVVERLRTLTYYMRIGGLGFTLVLAVTAILVLIVIVSMRMRTRQEEAEILDLIGATAGFIRSPIIIESLIYSIGGAFLGWLLALIMVLYSTPSLISYFGDIPILPRETASLFSLFGLILAGELIVGLFLGLLGSMLAVSRVRKNK